MAQKQDILGQNYKDIYTDVGCMLSDLHLPL